MPAQQETNSIDLVLDAISLMVSERDPGAVVTTAVVVYETSEISDDPERGIEYEVNYSVVTDTGLASAIGVMTIGKKLLLESATVGDDE